MSSKVSGELAVTAERRVQTTVRVVTRDSKVVVGRSSHHDLAVGLDGDGPTSIGNGGKVSRHLPAVAEAGIQIAVGVVAREGKTIPPGSTRHNLAIRLNDDASDKVVAATEVSRHLAARTEAGVHRAVSVEAHKSKVTVSSAGQYDLSVSSNRNDWEIIVNAIAEIRRHDSAGAESGIETAIGVVARNGDSAPRLGIVINACSNQDNLAVGLKSDAFSCVQEAGHVGRDQATIAKGGIETAVGVVACQSKPARSPPNDDNLAVGLDSQVIGDKTAKAGAAEVRRHLAITTKTRVEVARKRLCRLPDTQGEKNYRRQSFSRESETIHRTPFRCAWTRGEDRKLKPKTTASLVMTILLKLGTESNRCGWKLQSFDLATAALLPAAAQT